MTEDVTPVGLPITPALEKRLDEVLAESGFAQRETEAAKKLADSLEPPQRPLLADGDASERVPPEYDADYLSPEEYRRYGISENEAHTWLRNPRKWEQVEGFDSLAAWLRERSGRRVITHDGHMVTNADRVLVAFPKEELERRDRMLAEMVKDAEARLKDGDVSDSTPRFRGAPTSDEAYAAHEAHKAQGFIRQDGMTPEELLSRYGREGVERMEAYWRNGGMNVEVPEEPRARAEYEEQRARAEQPRSRKSFALGAGFDKKGRIVK